MSKRKVLPLVMALSMTVGSVTAAFAEICVRVNLPDVVIFNSHIDAPDQILKEGPNLFTPTELIGEIRVVADEYTMECKNETAGTDYVVDSYLTYYKVNLGPENVEDGDVISVNVKPCNGAEKTFIVHFDNPDAGYVATLTDYDIYDSCYGENPLESNEEEYFWPKDSGEIPLPYEYNRRIRIRPLEGFSLVEAWNENETNPHYEHLKPNGYGVIEISEFTLGVNHKVKVKTAEHGFFSVKAVGNKVDDLTMRNNMNFEYVDLSPEFVSLEYTGQTYVINSPSCSISKIEVTNGERKESLIGFDDHAAYIYTPNNGDEVVIYANDGITITESIINGDVDTDEVIYDLNGVAIRNNMNGVRVKDIPSGIYIRNGKKIRVK